MNTGKTSWDDLKKRRNINVAKWAERYKPQTLEQLNRILYKMSVRPLRFDHEDIVLLLSYSLEKREVYGSQPQQEMHRVEIPKEPLVSADDIVDYKTDKKLEAKEFNKFLSTSGFKQNVSEADEDEEETEDDE